MAKRKKRSDDFEDLQAKGIGCLVVGLVLLFVPVARAAKATSKCGFQRGVLATDLHKLWDQIGRANNASSPVLGMPQLSKVQDADMAKHTLTGI